MEKRKRHKQSLYHDDDDDDDAELLVGVHDGEVIRSIQVMNRETKENH
jgi:hypothetical protein